MLDLNKEYGIVLEGIDSIFWETFILLEGSSQYKIVFSIILTKN